MWLSESIELKHPTLSAWPTAGVSSDQNKDKVVGQAGQPPEGRQQHREEGADLGNKEKSAGIK